MEKITENEMAVVLRVFKDFDTRYNANNLSKMLGLSAMGTLKILKSLEKKDILSSETIGKAVFYKINFSNPYTKTYLKFLLEREAEQAVARIKRWVKELRVLKNKCRLGIMFGSVLRSENYNDVDLLLVLGKSCQADANKILSGINQVSMKHVHVVKQSISDLKHNLKVKDKIVLNAVNSGIAVFGYDLLVEAVESVSR